MVYNDHTAVLQYYNYSILNDHRASSSSKSLLKITDINGKKYNLRLLIDMFTQFYSKLCILEWENLKNPN